MGAQQDQHLVFRPSMLEELLDVGMPIGAALIPGRGVVLSHRHIGEGVGLGDSRPAECAIQHAQRG